MSPDCHNGRRAPPALATLAPDDVSSPRPWSALISSFSARASSLPRGPRPPRSRSRSEEHTSELQSPCNLVCRLLLEKKKKTTSLNSHLQRTHSSSCTRPATFADISYPHAVHTHVISPSTAPDKASVSSPQCTQLQSITL